MSTTAPGETTGTPDAPSEPARLDAPAEPAAPTEPTEPIGLLTIAELARWASVAPATVRYYEDLGLLEGDHVSAGKQLPGRAGDG